MATITGDNNNNTTTSKDLPMPTPTKPNRPFTTFKLLSFDIYGTLIDWETGILSSLNELITQIPATNKYYEDFNPQSRTNTQPQEQEQEPEQSHVQGQVQSSLKTKLAALFNDIEHSIQTQHPTLKYSSLLTQTYLTAATTFDIPHTDTLNHAATSFGASIKTWQPFPDTVDAMHRLSKHFKLVPLSNVDRDSFGETLAGPLKGIPFWRVYTAQDIGSYKPDLRNFEYLLRQADEDDQGEGGEGIKKEDVLQVAQSLFHDHRPAKEMGISSVWINRKNAGMGSADGINQLHQRGEVGYGWRFSTLGEFADEVDRQVAAGEK